MASTTYQVNIGISEATLTALANSGFYLYGFKAVSSSDQAARPLVWLQTPNCAQTTIVAWSNEFEAFISDSTVNSNDEIIVGTSVAILLGQTWQVESSAGGPVFADGSQAGISILNQTSQPLACGISEKLNGSALQVCASPLNGNGLSVIVPLDKLILLFSTISVPAGSVIDGAFSLSGPGAYTSAILVDLTDDAYRSVNFDINEGWNWGGYAWARQISSNSSVVPYLIHNPSSH